MEHWLLGLIIFLVGSTPAWLVWLEEQSWPLAVRRVIALLLIGVFAIFMGWVLLLPIRGDAVVVRAAPICLSGYLLFGLFIAYRFWPRHEKTPLMPDVQQILNQAIAETESQLGLSSIERLEKLNPREGTYSHTLVRYGDGSWLEWLNPTDEKGAPDFSYFAVYSNNRQIVKILKQRVGRYCNVEQQDKPLWR